MIDIVVLIKPYKTLETPSKPPDACHPDSIDMDFDVR
jgi:hypothetical protein